MDQKAWLWKKRSAEKTLAADKANNSFISNEEEEEEEAECRVEKLLTEKGHLERDLRVLNEKLSSALSECSSKDNIAKKQVKIAQEAIAGWEKAEAEAISLKKDLDRVLQQKADSEERLSHLDAVLKERMQQLRLVREEQEKRVQGAVLKAMEEFERTRIGLDEKLAEASKRVARLVAENAQLNKALSGKGKVIEELSKYRAQVETDINALMSRVESTEKENASLKYEVRVLEKELEIRNEEREVNRRTAEVAQKQHKESVTKIEKLQTECQRLRLLVQKRLPGPAALVKMKNEVEMLGRGQVEMRRRRSNPSLISSMDFRVDLAADDSPSKRINFLNEQLHKVEEENRSLKHALNMKSSEQLSRTIPARTTSRLSREEGQDGDLLKSQTAKESGKYPFSLQEHSHATLSDMGSDDKASCAESWASALLSELEHFKNDKQLGTPPHRNMATSDMNLMDDFAEMEKLAEASADCPAGGPHHSPEVRGHVFQTTPNKSLNLEAFDIGNDSKISTTEKSDQKFQSIVSISIQKILELLEGINIISRENGVAESLTAKDVEVLPCKISAAPRGYMVRVFQWKTDELSAVLKQFVQTCNDLLNGKADLQQFAQLVASDLEWLMNHSFSLQDVSSMKDAIRSHLDWNESKSKGESEVDSGSANHSTESSQPHVEREDRSYPPMVSPLNGCNSSCQMEELQRKPKGEAKRLSVEGNNESLVSDLKGGLPSEIANGESFRIQLKDSEDIIDNLPTEMETMGQSKGKIGDEIEKQMMTKEDLETQLVSGQSCQKISPPDSDLENNDTSCKRLEETCSGLTMQLNSMTSNEVQDDGNPWEKQLQDDWEIKAASEKLAECQETILNLRKQLKALATPRDAALFDNVISTPADHVVTRTSIPEKNVSQRFSLLDKMLAEDNDQIGVSPRTAKDDISNGNSNSVVSTSAAIESWSKFADSNGISPDAGLSPVVSKAIVPCKKKGGINFWKKLFWRHKKGNSKKAPFSKLQ
ncbi:filament-like plant protein 7 [Sesamum indicum]|uniref:Filament-like plant protein 7 n=1 Tax=Sesamum indicum TaxID=4182 RepID=A0A6I9UG21_SESIN|nr:filament-like plant protein 7 [Sesamum indicum]